jgi:hypothetical protein
MAPLAGCLLLFFFFAAVLCKAERVRCGNVLPHPRSPSHIPSQSSYFENCRMHGTSIADMLMLLQIANDVPLLRAVDQLVSQLASLDTHLRRGSERTDYCVCSAVVPAFKLQAMYPYYEQWVRSHRNLPVQTHIYAVVQNIQVTVYALLLYPP